MRYFINKTHTYEKYVEQFNAVVRPLAEARRDLVRANADVLEAKGTGLSALYAEELRASADKQIRVLTIGQWVDSQGAEVIVRGVVAIDEDDLEAIANAEENFQEINESDYKKGLKNKLVYAEIERLDVVDPDDAVLNAPGPLEA